MQSHCGITETGSFAELWRPGGDGRSGGRRGALLSGETLPLDPTDPATWFGMLTVPSWTTVLGLLASSLSLRHPEYLLRFSALKSAQADSSHGSLHQIPTQLRT